MTHLAVRTRSSSRFFSFLSFWLFLWANLTVLPAFFDFQAVAHASTGSGLAEGAGDPGLPDPSKRSKNRVQSLGDENSDYLPNEDADEQSIRSNKDNKKDSEKQVSANRKSPDGTTIPVDDAPSKSDSTFGSDSLPDSEDELTPRSQALIFTFANDDGLADELSEKEQEEIRKAIAEDPTQMLLFEEEGSVAKPSRHVLDPVEQLRESKHGGQTDDFTGIDPDTENQPLPPEILEQDKGLEYFLLNPEEVLAEAGKVALLTNKKIKEIANRGYVHKKRDTKEDFEMDYWEALEKKDPLVTYESSQELKPAILFDKIIFARAEPMPMVVSGKETLNEVKTYSIRVVHAKTKMNIHFHLHPDLTPNHPHVKQVTARRLLVSGTKEGEVGLHTINIFVKEGDLERFVSEMTDAAKSDQRIDSEIQKNYDLHKKVKFLKDPKKYLSYYWQAIKGFSWGEVIMTPLAVGTQVTMSLVFGGGNLSPAILSAIFGTPLSAFNTLLRNWIDLGRSQTSMLLKRYFISVSFAEILPIMLHLEKSKLSELNITDPAYQAKIASNVFLSSMAKTKIDTIPKIRREMRLNTQPFQFPPEFITNPLDKRFPHWKVKEKVILLKRQAIEGQLGFYMLSYVPKIIDQASNIAIKGVAIGKILLAVSIPVYQFASVVYAKHVGYDGYVELRNGWEKSPIRRFFIRPIWLAVSVPVEAVKSCASFLSSKPEAEAVPAT